MNNNLKQKVAAEIINGNMFSVDEATEAILTLIEEECNKARIDELNKLVEDCEQTIGYEPEQEEVVYIYDIYDRIKELR